MLMTLEFLTVAFLVAVFVAAEIWRGVSGKRGVIVSMNDDGLSFAAMGVGSVDVRLESGEQVTASVNCCTACLGRLRIGDPVRVCHSKEGYVADLPWLRGRRCDTNKRANPASGCP
jgi:hypothetical protein